MYAYVAFLVVFLSYGMETAFFRFSTTNKDGKLNIYSNTLYSLITSSVIFVAMAIIFCQDIADWLKYPNHKEYIIWFSLIVSLDAISSIPLAKLRLQEKAKKFALVNLLNVGLVNHLHDATTFKTRLHPEKVSIDSSVAARSSMFAFNSFYKDSS